jgi:LPS export ABC transporter protein LptC
VTSLARPRSDSLVLAHLALLVLVVLVMSCSEDGTPPSAVTAADTADQVFFGLKHHLTVDGVLRAELEADTAYFYQVPQRADLRQVRVVFYSSLGERTSNLTSREGTYDWRTGNMEARGNVVAVTPDGRCLTTTVLRYDRPTNKISGPADFVFDGPDRHLEGESFTSDPDFRNVATTRPRRGGASQGSARCR